MVDEPYHLYLEAELEHFPSVNEEEEVDQKVVVFLMDKVQQYW